MRTAFISILALLALPTSAHAARTSATIDWTKADGGGDVVAGTTITLTRQGTSYLFTGPVGPTMGNRSTVEDFRLDFDRSVSDFCIFIAGQNIGEEITVKTSASSGDTIYTQTLTGGTTFLVTGNVVRVTSDWSGALDAKTSAVCVRNSSGLRWVDYDHNGVGAGLVANNHIEIDAGCSATTWYLDSDGDGYGLTGSTTSACSAPSGYAALDGDCDDDDDSRYPDAFEVVADGIDQSCDDQEICYVDGDEDGWRTDDTVVSPDADCDDLGEALVDEDAGDCDDSVASVYPGAAEVPYDGVDQDCDGEDWCDVDSDGFDDPRCGGLDCADDDSAVNPFAAEVWYDGVDADCDGWSDFDQDLDGFDDDDDCDDTDDTRSPAATEIWYDGVDQDCDGLSDYDRDGDGVDALAHGGGDCDDLSAATYPGAPEIDDGLDNDCNGYAEGDDFDGDGLADELELELGLDPDSDDSDGDGVLDRDELGDPDDPRDSDGDGIIDALDDDDDGDGIASAIEVAQSLKTIDSDSDGTPDHLDTDSDDDGYLDIDEGNVDSDRDGVADYIDVDSDEDGVPDADEFDGDTDGDGVPDRLDTDDDGDGIATSEELSWGQDLDGDGVPNHLDDDSDGDGVSDADEGWADVDCDAVMDVQEADAADGPCAEQPVTTFQSGCSSTSTPIGLGGMGLALLALIGLRRRRA